MRRNVTVRTAQAMDTMPPSVRTPNEIVGEVEELRCADRAQHAAAAAAAQAPIE